MSDLIERPTDAADPTYPDAERCAQTLENCEDDLLTEAQFVRWQGQEIERLTAALRAQPGPVSIDDMEWAGKVHLAEAIRERDELRRKLAESEQRFDWLTERLEDVQIDDVDPNDHYYDGEEDVPFPILWRRAIDAAMGLTRPAEES